MGETREQYIAQQNEQILSSKILFQFPEFLRVKKLHLVPINIRKVPNNVEHAALFFLGSKHGKGIVQMIY